MLSWKEFSQMHSKKQLRQRIKGTISVHVIDDILIKSVFSLRKFENKC